MEVRPRVTPNSCLMEYRRRSSVQCVRSPAGFLRSSSQWGQISRGLRRYHGIDCSAYAPGNPRGRTELERKPLLFKHISIDDPDQMKQLSQTPFQAGSAFGLDTLQTCIWTNASSPTLRTDWSWTRLMRFWAIGATTRIRSASRPPCSGTLAWSPRPRRRGASLSL
jgi:hypothetical protein